MEILVKPIITEKMKQMPGFVEITQMSSGNYYQHKIAQAMVELLSQLQVKEEVH